MKSSHTLALLWFGLFGCLGLFAHGFIENTDAEITMHSARAWYLRGEPAMYRSGEAQQVSGAEDFIATSIREDSYLGRTGVDGAAYSCFSIGHQLLMLPCVALGEALAVWFPEPELALAAQRPAGFGDFFWTRFLVSFLPIAAAAGSLIVLLLIAQLLGLGAGESLLVAAVAGLCTQFGGSTSETLSNGPGGFFLAASVLGCLWNHLRAPSPTALCLAGASAGFAVLIRYEQAAAVILLTAWTLWSCWRQGKIHLVWFFVVAGIPAAVFLAWMNAQRFGSVFDAGYTGADQTWWSYPAYLGITQLLLSPGKGVIWFSLPIVWAFSCCWHQRMRNSTLLLAAGLWLTPLIIVGHTHGWHGSQCWGVRYVTIGTSILVCVALAIDKPWRRRPMIFGSIAVLGLLIAIGGVLTPYRGQFFLADRAARQVWQPELDQGVIPADALQDHYIRDYRFSPLHTHWRYAWHAASGELGPGPAENNTKLVFGIEGPLPEPVPEFPREDLGFRHWWWRYLADLVPFNWLPVVLIWALVSLTSLTLGIRGWMRRPKPISPPSS